MLRSGKDHLETLRDGRIVYVGSEKVDDVTRHPAFREAAATVAAWADAGCSWWLETRWEARDQMRDRLAAGPPGGRKARR